MATWNEWIEIFKNDNVDIQWEIRNSTSGGVAYNSDIVEDSVSITESVLSGNVIKFGGFENMQLSFKYSPRPAAEYFFALKFEKGNQVNIKIYVRQETDIEVCYIGTFIVESCVEDDNGIGSVVAYKIPVIDKKTSNRFNASVKNRNIYYAESARLGLLYRAALSELGMRPYHNGVLVNEFSSWNRATLVSTGSITDYITALIDGVSKNYKVKYFQYSVTPDVSVPTDYYLETVKYPIDLEYLNSLYGGDQANIYAERKWFKYHDGAEWREVEVNPVCYASAVSFSPSCNVYDFFEVYDTSSGTDVFIRNGHIYKTDCILHYKTYSASYVYSMPGVTNSGWVIDNLPDPGNGLYLSTDGMSYADILENSAELMGCFNYTTRGIGTGGEIDSMPDLSLLSLSTNKLYPATNLYPATTLYPNGSILLYDKSMQYLGGLKSKKITVPYFRSIITGNGVLVTNKDIFIVNLDGLVDYDISTNTLFDVFDFDYVAGDGLIGISNLVAKLAPIKFDSFSLDAIGLPNVLVGSKISIQAQDGTQVESYIMSRKLTGTKLLQDKLSNNITGGL